MAPIEESGTADDLVRDAGAAGHQVTKRLIWDWTSHGLLDHPQRRPRGRGHGSSAALYPWTQRELLLTLLEHRATNGIQGLARIPVAIWVYWGNDFVPFHQAKLAFRTWLGDPRVSRRAALGSAKTLLEQLDNPDATRSAKAALLGELTEIAYTGRITPDALTRVVCAVFEPNNVSVRRALGHPIAPMTAEAVVGLITAKIAAANHLLDNRVTDAAFASAREVLVRTRAEYEVQQPALAKSAPRHLPGLYEEPTWDDKISRCCGELLLIIGLHLTD